MRKYYFLPVPSPAPRISETNIITLTSHTRKHSHLTRSPLSIRLHHHHSSLVPPARSPYPLPPRPTCSSIWPPPTVRIDICGRLPLGLFTAPNLPLSLLSLTTAPLSLCSLSAALLGLFSPVVFQWICSLPAAPDELVHSRRPAPAFYSTTALPSHINLFSPVTALNIGKTQC